MIRVDAIVVEEFRGIRNITLELGGKNFAVCGPNGTGKSGIVDAIEFALTANVSRLSGAGTGGVSVKDHGPHVDSRNRPDKARVKLTVSVPTLRKTVSIERNIKNANAPVISPNEAEVSAVLDQLKQHPEFVLSRRELIRYVLSTPGDRAKEVQALLRLDQVESLRVVLQKIANAEERTVTPLKRDRAQAAEQLARALEIAQVGKEAVLGASNARRAVLGLPPLSELTSTTSLRDGLTTAASDQVPKVPKTQAVADMMGLRDLISVISGVESKDRNARSMASLEALGADPVAATGITRDRLLKDAIEMFDGSACPVCGVTWKPEEFRRVVADKLAHLEEIAKRRAAVEQELEPCITSLEQLQESLARVSGYGKALKPVIDTTSLDSYRTKAASWRQQLNSFLPINLTTNALRETSGVPEGVEKTLAELDVAIAALPEPTQQDAARDFLTVGQERLEAYRGASIKLKAGEERAALARRVFDTYTAASTSVLEGIYKKVEKDFSELYRFINQDDESAFSAQLTPSMGKLGFDVDFYGRGFFPPGAYHSEGHQDSMGLCLYLALMKHLLGDGFTFAVLDDVLMSVDSGHRREVCRLLKERFPDTQFIFTTHDPIWLRHMKSEGLIGPNAAVHFRKWTVDQGPTEWDQRDIWDEIDQDLKRNDVRAAAALLRHHLEYLAAELCHHLRAQVEYRGDAQYELGALLPGAIAAMRKSLKAGKMAAQSWGKKELVVEIDEREKTFSELAAKTNAEQWQINPAVHYNSWATLDKADFEPVVSAFKELMGVFFCRKCGSPLYVLPERGSTSEALRC